MRGALITLALIVIGVKLLVWWLEPRMAFFPWRGIQQTPAAYRSGIHRSSNYHG